MVGWSSGGGKACVTIDGAVTADGMLPMLPVMLMLVLMAKFDAVDDDGVEVEAMGGIIGMPEVNSAALVLSSASVSKGRKFR